MAGISEVVLDSDFSAHLAQIIYTYDKAMSIKLMESND